MKHPDRATAALISAIGAVSLAVLAYDVYRANAEMDALDVLWAMAGYFTVLTNLAVAVHFASVAAGRKPGASEAGCILLAILMVGGVYNLLLGAYARPTDLGGWSDVGLHTIVPALAALWWLAFAPKTPLGLRDLPAWLIWPGIYAAYMLIRGSLTGFWPYDFLDLPTLGIIGTALKLLEMIALFAAAGAAIIGLAKLSR